MYFGTACLVLAVAGACAGERWRWPEPGGGGGGGGEPAESIRIDSKVRFIDDGEQTDSSRRQNKVQADEIREPSETEGFYNRPPGAGAASGRYPVRAHPQRDIDAARTRQYSDGTLDSLQYCKCVDGAQCTPRTDLPKACASGMILCCYKRPSQLQQQPTEYFEGLEDERPLLLPSREHQAGAFASPEQLRPEAYPGGRGDPRPVLVGPSGPTGNIGPARRYPSVLVGPGGPAGHVGPDDRSPSLLVGPDGPTGMIGPDHRDPYVLVGPDGPTGSIGPMHSNHPDRGILVGPDGPSGEIGPAGSAQRGVLVGPGGPTGMLGPQQYGRRQVLVGPGGPTGTIGPGRGGRGGQAVLVGPGGPTGSIGPYGGGFGGGRTRAPGLLVGPGGPTGIIGPGRRLLVGPGGPTGHIGPYGPQTYFDN